MTTFSKERRPRMADVAEVAGVSRATASFVLNGRAQTIPTATRQRVFDAADKLGYRNNRIAQLLARNRTNLIGTSIPVVENPFFASLTAYLNHGVNRIGYRLIFEVTEDGADENARRQAVEELLDWRVDGLLLYNSEVYPQSVRDLIATTPTVFIGTRPPDAECDCVYLDDYAGARAAAEHLVELGHRAFCHILPVNACGGARERATRDVCASAGLPPPLIVPCATNSAADAHAAAEQVAHSGQRVTAVICHNDMLALGALRGFREAGFRVPADISIIGFDDNWAAAYSEPPLSTIEYPYKYMVDRALEFLVQRMSGTSPEGALRHVIPPRVVVRASTAPAPRPVVGS